jgi:glutathione-regulated potassium-efflux system ancillary protein KefC
MGAETIFFDLGIVIAVAALLSWISLILRQPVILGYILCGVLAGPWGFSLVPETEFVDGIGRVGVTLLLFLAGLVLHPQRLAQLFRQTAVVTVTSSALLFFGAAGLARLAGLGGQDALLTGMAFMFSSTILVVKLMPTTALHHRHMGALCIAVLIAQDLIAVACLLVIAGVAEGRASALVYLPLKAVALVVITFGVEQLALRRMLRRCDRFHETLYLLSIGWCLAIALLAERLGLSLEVGAFLAGMAMARNPVARFLSEGLKPFRDFFLVLFFFALGARLELPTLMQVLFPALLLALFSVTAKPLLLYALFKHTDESPEFSREAAFRLGQASEFSLILCHAAETHGVVSSHAAQVIQLATFLSLVASSYVVVLRFPTPLGRGTLQRG